MSANTVHPTRKKKRNPAMGFRPALVMVVSLTEGYKKLSEM